MDFGKLEQLRLCYQSKTMAIEEKVKDIRMNISELAEFYEDDLKLFFGAQQLCMNGNLFLNLSGGYVTLKIQKRNNRPQSG